MDYMKFVEYHRDQGADITVGCLPVDYERASDFGLMNIDDQGVVTVSVVPTLTAKAQSVVHVNTLLASLCTICQCVTSKVSQQGLHQ